MPLGRRGLFVTILGSEEGQEPAVVKQVRGYDDTSAGNPGLRVKFEISKKLDPRADTATVEIYNLNANSRSATARRFLELLQDPVPRTLQINAGYRSPDRDGLSWHPLSLLFNGAIHYVHHSREGPDWVTTIEASAGLAEATRNYLDKSWDSPAGTSLRQIISELVAQMGRGRARYSDQAERVLAGRVVSSQVVSGSVTEALRKMLRATGLIYYMDPTGVWITAPDRPLSEATADVVEVSEDTGLIGTPKLGNQGASLRTLLDGRISPGQLMRVVSQTLEASTPGLGNDYTAYTVEMSGDTHADEWYADINAIFYPPLPDVPEGGSVALVRAAPEQR